MEFYGISGKSNNSIKSYVQDRRQRTLVYYDPKMYYFEMDSFTDEIPWGFIFGPLLFLLCVNDIPNVISDISNQVLYAGDTSFIIKNSKSQMLEKSINTAIRKLNIWFSNNRLLLNLEKPIFLQFLTKNCRASGLQILYQNRRICIVHSAKFPVLENDDNLSWHCHIDQIITKLKKVSYVIRFLKPLLPFEALKMVYFSKFHSIISYCIIFWGSSTYSIIIFKKKKNE
jgi:hypothetical protein